MDFNKSYVPETGGPDVEGKTFLQTNATCTTSDNKGKNGDDCGFNEQCDMKNHQTCLRYTINITMPDPINGGDKTEEIVFSEKCGATSVCNTTAAAADGTETYVRCPSDDIGAIKITLAVFITLVSSIYLMF